MWPFSKINELEERNTRLTIEIQKIQTVLDDIHKNVNHDGKIVNPYEEYEKQYAFEEIQRNLIEFAGPPFSEVESIERMFDYSNVKAEKTLISVYENIDHNSTLEGVYYISRKQHNEYVNAYKAYKG